MNVAVIGAGIIGITTALRLAEDGHQVTVYESNATVAEGTSFANAGVIAPGYVTPWSAPGMPAKVLTQLFSRQAAVRFHPRLHAEQWRWLLRWWRASRTQPYLAHRSAMQALAAHSLLRLRHWRSRYGFEYQQGTGYLQLLRSEKELRQLAPALEMLKAMGTAYAVVDAVRARQIEPDLSVHARLHAAVHLPADEVGNCRLFAWQARRAAQALGVHFAFRTAVQSISNTDNGISLDLNKNAGEQPYTATRDAVVVCAGLAGRALLAPLGLRLPLLAVWGYSLSAPLRDAALGPRSGVMDERYKTAITRLGDRVRVAGTAEIGAQAGHMNEGAIDTLYAVLREWFPSRVDLGRAQLWMGARPMLPEGPPVIGPTALPGVFVNLGHGSSGWALACGSADLLADQLAQREPSLAATPYLVARYAT